MNNRCEGLTNTVITLIYKNSLLVRVAWAVLCSAADGGFSVADFDVTFQLTVSFIVTTARASNLTFYVTSVTYAYGSYCKGESHIRFEGNQDLFFQS
jgi:hypothetical protein